MVRWLVGRMVGWLGGWKVGLMVGWLDVRMVNGWMLDGWMFGW